MIDEKLTGLGNLDLNREQLAEKALNAYLTSLKASNPNNPLYQKWAQPLQETWVFTVKRVQENKAIGDYFKNKKEAKTAFARLASLREAINKGSNSGEFSGWQRIEIESFLRSITSDKKLLRSLIVNSLTVQYK